MKDRIIEQMALLWLPVYSGAHPCDSLSPSQTRDDFLGQVDVPLNQIPVSLCY